MRKRTYIIIQAGNGGAALFNGLLGILRFEEGNLVLATMGASFCAISLMAILYLGYFYHTTKD